MMKLVERAALGAGFLLMGIATIAGFFGILLVFGLLVEGYGERTQGHERCLRQATNGLEIERCR